MTNLGPVLPQETIARVLPESGLVARATKRVRMRAFFLSDGMDEISVHRRSHMSEEEAILYAMMAVQPRGKSWFHGWAEMPAEKAEGHGRRVFASPNENPRHATIKLPPGAATDRQARRFHAQMLAERSIWVEPPSEFPAHLAG